MTFTAEGIDFSFGNGLTTAEMRANGVEFVGRYISTPGNPKNIDRAELDDYKAADIPIVIFFETGGMMDSEDQGESDALLALDQVAALGRPDAPVFFTLDTDPRAPGVIDAATSYMNGVAKHIPWHQRGAYGGLAWVQAYFNRNLGKFACQTYAWSEDMEGIVQWDSRAQLQQYENDVNMGPAKVDHERATRDDYGQTPRPQPPVPSINPVQDLKVARGFTGANLSWRKPEGVVTGYTVKVTNMRSGKLVQTLEVTETAIRIHRLNPLHCDYFITVRAHPGNSVGADASVKFTTR